MASSAYDSVVALLRAQNPLTTLPDEILDRIIALLPPEDMAQLCASDQWFRNFCVQYQLLARSLNAIHRFPVDLRTYPEERLHTIVRMLPRQPPGQVLEYRAFLAARLRAAREGKDYINFYETKEWEQSLTTPFEVRPGLPRIVSVSIHSSSAYLVGEDGRLYILFPKKEGEDLVALGYAKHYDDAYGGMIVSDGLPHLMQVVRGEYNELFLLTMEGSLLTLDLHGPRFVIRSVRTPAPIIRIIPAPLRVYFCDINLQMYHYGMGTLQSSGLPPCLAIAKVIIDPRPEFRLNQHTYLLTPEGVLLHGDDRRKIAEGVQSISGRHLGLYVLMRNGYLYFIPRDKSTLPDDPKYVNISCVATDPIYKDQAIFFFRDGSILFNNGAYTTSIIIDGTGSQVIAAYYHDSYAIIIRRI